jgi:hypothetical protein
MIVFRLPDRLRRAAPVALTAIVAVVAGCGTTTPSAAPASPPVASTTQEVLTPVPIPGSSGTSTQSAPPSPESGGASPAPSLAGPGLTGRLECAGWPEISFEASALDEPGNAELAQNAQALALRAFVTSPDHDGVPVSGWHVVSAGPDRVDYLAPGRDGWWVVSVEDIEDQGGWQAWEDGRCDLQVTLPKGVGFATWELDPANPPAPGATTLTVLATELACASGRPMAGRLMAPILIAAPDAVTIALVVRTLSGDQDCQGNGPEPVIVTLAEPLRDQALFDGSSFPAERRN